MRMCIKRLLKEHGFDTTLFASPNALLSHGDFDSAFCIILDIDLNGESGIVLRHHLAGIGVGLPVIYVTGGDSEANRVAAIKSGCLAYLTKPFAACSLIQSIEQASAAAA